MSSVPATVLCHLPDGYLHLDELKKLFPKVEFVQVPITGPVPPDVFGEVLITIAAPSDNLLDLLGRGVRWVHCSGHGVDHLPLEAFGDRLLTCSRGVASEAIAEWVMAMVLAWTKRLPDTWVDAPPEEWFLTRLDRLAEATVALVGLGSINVAVAKRLVPFRCRILGVRRNPGPTPLSDIEIVASPGEAVAEADHLVVAAPLTPTTHHIVDDDLLAIAKPGIHLINVARGRLVDQEALRRALNTGRVGRASLDVADPEPLPEGHWLYKHPRVLISPHVSWAGPGYSRRVTDMFAANLDRWLAGHQLEGLVDLEAGY